MEEFGRIFTNHGGSQGILEVGPTPCTPRRLGCRPFAGEIFVSPPMAQRLNVFTFVRRKGMAWSPFHKCRCGGTRKPFHFCFFLCFLLCVFFVVLCVFGVLFCVFFCVFCLFFVPLSSFFSAVITSSYFDFGIIASKVWILSLIFPFDRGLWHFFSHFLKLWPNVCTSEIGMDNFLHRCAACLHDSRGGDKHSQTSTRKPKEKQKNVPLS